MVVPITTEETPMITESSAPVRQYPVIREYMTSAPHTIGRTQSLSSAAEAMHRHHVRHLPVLDGNQVVGVLSERDLLLVESLPGVDPAVVTVEDAMVEDPYMVTPDTPVGEVIETMIQRKLGSVLVGEDQKVVGVFTHIDALRALHEQLERR
jgi:acetoin utilization protein AcuB